MSDASAVSPVVEQFGNRQSEFLGGLKATIPLVVGGIPFGIIFGALAVTSGLSPAAAIGMSMFVYAGSAQFIGVGLVASFTPLPIIWLTTFVVNVRHSLYAASLAPYMRHLPQRWLIPLAFWMTDETYLIAINHYEQPQPSPYRHYYYFGSAIMMYVSWQLATVVGVLFGSAVPDASRWGLDFAMSATFIGMLVPTIKGRPTLAAVITAGFVAVVAQPLPNQLWLILATLAGVVAGVLAERRWSQPRPPDIEHEARAEAEMAIDELS